MPYRKTPIVANETYHVFNRSIAKLPIFLDKRDYQRAIEVIDFYRYGKPTLRFSHFRRLTPEDRKKFLNNLSNNTKPIIEILVFCLMPNHVHCLIVGSGDNAISNFMANFQHSYSKYFNAKYNRTGGLFQSIFKAVRIESDEQLVHVSRYIHLNPVSSFLIKLESLPDYPWSSFRHYLNSVDKKNFVSKDLVLSYFKSNESYQQFVYDQANYQKELEKIKHLTLE